MAESPTASIVVPTRSRPDYLGVTLASIMSQARDAGAEVLVISDGVDRCTATVAQTHGVTLVSLPESSGLNAARNAGIRASKADLIVFIDDDVEAPPSWLDSLLRGAREAPDHEVFGGPIHARLEGRGIRACGRESAPITTLDFGPRDRDVPCVWGANMAVRRVAFRRLGNFEERLAGRGDEEEWEYRYTSAGGRIRYVARAGLDHRRKPADATLRALARADYRLGRSARRNDVRKREAPPLRAELRTLAGCLWHTIRRRCANGVVMTAHTAGRIREALSERSRPAEPPQDDFLSGESGEVSGIRSTTRALAADSLACAYDLALLRRWRLRRAAARWPRRRILVLAVERDDAPNVLAEARDELLRTRHEVSLLSTGAGSQGKFQNLNSLLRDQALDNYDWLVVVDDDVTLPPGFLDAFVFVAERFQLRLAQPAHRQRSHAAWRVTRRKLSSVVRETRYVEIGPVTAFQAITFDTLLPFPDLRFGWGLCAHWSAVAEQREWRIGVVDATPIRHGMRRVAASYRHADAIAEAREFLAGRPYNRAVELQQTLVVHGSWR